jgi:hypothetical protein
VADIEFPTRQDLAEALYGTSPEMLAGDGYTADHMPEGDRELRAAWRELEDAVEAVDAANARVKDLLPPSRKAAAIRDFQEGRRG